MDVTRIVVATLFMVAWGIATVVLALDGQKLPPEWWTIPGFGVGALLYALSVGNKPKKRPPNEED